MALKGYGAVGSIRLLAGARVMHRANGLEEGDCVFEVTGDPQVAGLMLEQAVSVIHPYRPWLYRESMEIVYQPAGAQARCSYAGVQYQYLDKPTYSLLIGVEESPIETHPKFNLIGGKPSAPLNGAIFLDPYTGLTTVSNSVGVFDRFPTFKSDGTKNPKGGIEAYQDPRVTYRESKVLTSLPPVTGFGRIVNDVPGPGFRGSLGQRNWLYTGFNYTRRGVSDVQSQTLYEINSEWILSGRNGWDEDIYGN